MRPAPGEGMFRKKPSMTANWEKSGPEYFGEIQRQILLNGADMLKPGGSMVYSTCTFSGIEDEGSVAYLLKERPEMELISQERLWPHKVDGEGHFCALLKKSGSEMGTREVSKFGAETYNFSKEPKDVESFERLSGCKD